MLSGLDVCLKQILSHGDPLECPLITSHMLGTVLLRLVSSYLYSTPPLSIFL